MGCKDHGHGMNIWNHSFQGHCLHSHETYFRQPEVSLKLFSLEVMASRGSVQGLREGDFSTNTDFN